MRRRLSAACQRKRRQNVAGAIMLAASVLGFAGLVGGAVKLDAMNGVTISESLASAGFGRASPDLPHRRFAADVRAAIGYERPAAPARLIGLCNGRVLAAMEESSFPAGCEWIEPIRYASKRLEREDSPDHSESM